MTTLTLKFSTRFVASLTPEAKSLGVICHKDFIQKSKRIPNNGGWEKLLIFALRQACKNISARYLEISQLVIFVFWNTAKGHLPQFSYISASCNHWG